MVRDLVTESARAEFARAWRPLLSAALGFGLGLSGLPFYTNGVFVEPLAKAFGWTTASIQGGLTLMLLFNMLTLPVVAVLVERFGARRVALTSVVAFGLSYMSLAAITGSLIDFYAHWLLVSAAGAGTLAVTWTKVITGWFLKGRGKALGVAMMGTGLTALFAPSLANFLIGMLGWRGAYAVLGALPMLISAPLVWAFFRERDGDAPKDETIRPSAQSVVGDYRFWLIGCAFILVGAAVSGVIPNLIKLLRVHGLSPSEAAGVASALGLFVILGRLACGALLDWIWASAVAALFFLLAALACLVLRAPHPSPIVLIASAAAVGLAAGAEFDLLPYLASRYFGQQRVTRALGQLSIFFFLGAAAGPWGFGRLIDLTKTYNLPLMAAAALFAVGGLALLFTGRYPVFGPIDDPAAPWS